MGECGCATMDIIKTLTFDGKAIGVSIYPGCDDCAPLIGISLYCFDKDGYKEWVEDWCNNVEEVSFDEFGGNQGFGWSIPIVDADKFTEALEGMREMYAVDFNEYGSIEDFLEDWGLTLLQEVFRRTITEWQAMEEKDNEKEHDASS